MSASPPSAAPFELLESKLLPPQGHGRTVSRGELIGSLEGSGAPPLVLLSAAPGWGKTTLLAQWASRSQRPFAWVSVDEKDNDPIVLLTYVAVALDRVSPLDPGVFDALASPGVSVEATVVPRLGAALAEMSEQIVLTLDDLHLLSNHACLDAIEALARHVSEGSQMALSARGRPALPVAAWRTRGLTLEIGLDDLRMSEAEARQLLSAAGVDLGNNQVAELTERTEGWPAGLYLAALSIRARGPGAMGAAPFSGSDRVVSDYLRSELLAHMPADDIRFLTRSSVLGRMSGPLCDDVLKVKGSAARLESYARSNLLVVPLDANGEWYRYHHLFQEMLRSDLARAEPDLERSLLARASEWCEANGQLETAIGYAQQACDIDRVARLFERCALSAYLSGRAATSERWLGWLEHHGALEQNALVAVIGGVIATAQGRPEQAERFADAAERAYGRTLPDASPTTLAWLCILRAQRCPSGVARMRADAESRLPGDGRCRRRRDDAARDRRRVAATARPRHARLRGGRAAREPENDAHGRPGASTLTEAELRLVPYLTTHLSFREIGERLYVSRNTVRSQAMAVYRKLNVTSRSGAVERALDSDCFRQDRHGRHFMQFA